MSGTKKIYHTISFVNLDNNQLRTSVIWDFKMSTHNMASYQRRESAY